MSEEVGALPEDAVAYRSTRIFTEGTIPDGLLHAHRTAPGVWGLIEVLEGRLLFRVPGSGHERMLAPQFGPGVAEPQVVHEVAPQGPVRFRITFYRRPEPAV
ncbi:MAG: DUF1971 domain-containing protein [Acetobacteraceae bacterium]